MNSDQSVVFEAGLIRKYDTVGPRYTSYPPALHFHTGFDSEALKRQIAATCSEIPQRPLSLYFHIPFCGTACFYCACNKIVTRDRLKAVPYLEHLYIEIERMGKYFEQRRVVQLHWGGGTPTFLSPDQMRELMNRTRAHFNLEDPEAGETSIEVDPRDVTSGTLSHLRELGFNRLSLGVQDLDLAVQKAVNRVQSPAGTFSVLEEARRLGFKSVSLDLIYGLPLQTVETFDRTLVRILEARPDRLALFNYAHLPSQFPTQQRILADQLPDPGSKLAMLSRSIEILTAAGYVYIGMDHFALPEDDLARAQRNGSLYRNFQGYSTHSDCDLVGLGLTSISQIGNSYSQNFKTLDDYYGRLQAGEIPVERGIELTPDDRIRRAVILGLICHFTLDFQTVEQAYNIRFTDYFASELDSLKEMEADGLLQLSPHRIQVLSRGRLLIRNICMVFDAYHQNQPGLSRYSKVI